MYRYIFSALFVMFLGSVGCGDIGPGLDLEIDLSSCDSDADCPFGQACGGLFSSCVQVCESHADCRPPEACLGPELFTSFSHCDAGCRVHEECDDDQACIQGRCAVGCRSDDNCDSGAECQTGRCKVPPIAVDCGLSHCEGYGSYFVFDGCCVENEPGRCGLQLRGGGDPSAPAVTVCSPVAETVTEDSECAGDCCGVGGRCGVHLPLDPARNVCLVTPDEARACGPD